MCQSPFKSTSRYIQLAEVRIGEDKFDAAKRLLLAARSQAGSSIDVKVNGKSLRGVIRKAELLMEKRRQSCNIQSQDLNNDYF